MSADGRSSSLLSRRRTCSTAICQKLRLFETVEQGGFVLSFEKNKEWHLHNEITMQILQNEIMYEGLSELLTIFTRSECMGAADGKCEGEVNKAKRRLMDRYRLDDEQNLSDFLGQTLSGSIEGDERKLGQTKLGEICLF